MAPLRISVLSLLLAVASVSAQSTAGPYGQCGGDGYTGPTQCSSGWTCVYSNQWYSQCLQGAASTSSTSRTTTSRTTTSTSRTTTSTSKTTTSTTVKPTTTATPTTTGGSGGATPTGLTTVFPAAAGSTTRPSAIVVSGNFDGGMVRYDRNPKVCAEQDETGEADAIFILENGATLSNVIIGPNQAEGVHCRGSCTLNNVWWEDVCEDGATFKQSSGTSYVNGGGAKGASDKVFQHNGFGTVAIKNFYVTGFGKLYRSCGNCSNNGGARHVTIDNIYANDGSVLAGINTNYGDTARISNSCVIDTNICDRYKGTTSGEPSKIGSGPDGTYCIATNIRTSC